MSCTVVFVTALLLLASNTIPSQAQNPQGREEEVVRVNTALVSVPVTVRDRNGRYVIGLQKEDFRLYENDHEQTISFFSPVETPFTVALMIDASPSTVPILNDLVEMANLFMNRMRPDDRFLLLFFDLKVHELVKSTSLRELRPGQIKFQPKCCGTSLYDAVDFALGKGFKGMSGRKAVILFTDGVDTTSRSTYQSTLRRAEEMDVLIYPIRFNTYVKREVSDEQRKVWKGVWSEDYARGEAYLQELAQRSGGRLYRGDRFEELMRAFESIVQALRWQYSLGYYPQAAGRAGERRQIKVQVKESGLIVEARESYIYNRERRKSDKE